MSKIISTTIANPNGKEDTCALVQVTGQELYYLLRPIDVIGRYTISFFVKAEANETIIVHYGEQSKQFAITTSWQRVVFSFNAEHIDNVMIQFTTGNYYLYNTQLENGDVATDYTLSPEDAEEQLKGVEANLIQMYSEVVQSLNSFKVEVGANYSTKESVKAELEVKIDKDDNDQVVSMINASADKIHLKSNEFSIESDYFTLKDGQINAIGGEIGGWEITETGISKETEAYVPPLYSHAERIRQYILNEIELTEEELAYYDFNGDGVVNLMDALRIRRIHRGDIEYKDTENAVKSPLTIEFNPNDGTKTLRFISTNPLGELVESSVGVLQAKFPSIMCDYFNGKDIYGTEISGASIETEAGANLDTVNEKASMKKVAYPFNVLITMGTSSKVIANNVLIEGYTLVSMVVDVNSTTVLDYTITPQLFNGTQLHLKAYNHTEATTGVSGNVICYYVNNTAFE